MSRNININLVLREDTGGLRHKRNVKISRLATLGILFLVLFSAVLIYLLNLRFDPASLQKDQDEITNQLFPLREREAKINIINDRVKNIISLREKRTDVHKIVNTLLGEVPVGMSVENLEFTQELVAIKVSSYSLVLVDEFFNNLIGMAERKEMIGTLILNVLDVTESGQYSASLNIGLI